MVTRMQSCRITFPSTHHPCLELGMQGPDKAAGAWQDMAGYGKEAPSNPTAVKGAPPALWEMTPALCKSQSPSGSGWK